MSNPKIALVALTNIKSYIYKKNVLSSNFLFVTEK